MANVLKQFNHDNLLTFHNNNVLLCYKTIYHGNYYEIRCITVVLLKNQNDGIINTAATNTTVNYCCSVSCTQQLQIKQLSSRRHGPRALYCFFQ